MLVYASPDLRHSLLSSTTSRRNKIWLAKRFVFEGGYLQWEWKGEPYRSRLIFRFCPGDVNRVALSYDEDVVPLLELNSGTRVA